MLLLDRFLSAEGSALDLSTGAAVRIRGHARATTTPLYTARGGWRLIDAGPRSVRVFVEVWSRADEAPIRAAVPIDAVRAALHDARDGCPRAVDVCAEDGPQWRRTTLEIAREARLTGFVPVGAGVLGELLRGNRWQWPRWLADRSLVVFICDGQVTASAAVALLRLAGRDARPHLVVRGATRGTTATLRLLPAPAMVHEGPGGIWAPPEALPPDALAAQAWHRAAEEGRADDETAATARWAMMLAPSADTNTTARAALALTLAAQGRVLEARAALPPDQAPGISPAVQRRVEDARRRVSDAEQPRRGDRALTTSSGCSRPASRSKTSGRRSRRSSHCCAIGLPPLAWRALRWNGIRCASSPRLDRCRQTLPFLTRPPSLASHAHRASTCPVRAPGQCGTVGRYSVPCGAGGRRRCPYARTMPMG